MGGCQLLGEGSCWQRDNRPLQRPGLFLPGLFCPESRWDPVGGPALSWSPTSQDSEEKQSLKVGERSWQS